jgi:transcriptional regulator with XRE-family HTH domain
LSESEVKKRLKISLKAARVNCGLTQKEAAARIKINPTTLSKWENGKTYPTADKLAELCRVYGLGIDDVFCGGGSVKPNNVKGET